MRSIQISHPAADRGPCIPAALSVVLGVSFDEINNWLVYRGYRDARIKAKEKSLACGGTATWKLNFEAIGMVRVRDNEMIGKSVNQFAKRFTEGSFLIIVSGHGLAVKQGIAYDTRTNDPSKNIVKEVYKKIGDRLPSDWQQAQLMIKEREKNIGRQISEKQKRENKKEYYKKLKVQLKAKKNAPEYKLEQLLKRKKQWSSKLKKAQTYLKKVERAIKRVEKKVIK